MKNLRLIIFSGALALTVSAFTKPAEADSKQNEHPKIKFVARCEPDSPKKKLIIVNDTCFYLIAPKGEGTKVLNMEELGIKGLYEVRYFKTDSDEGRKTLKSIPREYNNQLTQVILKVYQK